VGDPMTDFLRSEALHYIMNGEYAGFFDIGMVQRNECNAIIVHGTMCLIRRSLVRHSVADNNARSRVLQVHKLSRWLFAPPVGGNRVVSDDNPPAATRALFKEGAHIVLHRVTLSDEMTTAHMPRRGLSEERA
jgi:hypothetical protein